MSAMARRWLRWLGIGMFVAWALSLTWWMVLEPAAAEGDVYELIIPRGTAAAVADGQPAPLIPNSLELGRNKRLLVLNRDSAPHQFGTWTIPPGGRAEITADETDGQLSCTITTAGVIGVTVEERPPFWTAIVSAFGVGIPIGLVFGFASFVGTRLRAAVEDQDAATPLE